MAGEFTDYLQSQASNTKHTTDKNVLELFTAYIAWLNAEIKQTNDKPQRSIMDILVQLKIINNYYIDQLNSNAMKANVDRMKLSTTIKRTLSEQLDKMDHNVHDELFEIALPYELLDRISMILISSGIAAGLVTASVHLLTIATSPTSGLFGAGLFCAVFGALACFAAVGIMLGACTHPANIHTTSTWWPGFNRSKARMVDNIIAGAHIYPTIKEKIEGTNQSIVKTIRDNSDQTELYGLDKAVSATTKALLAYRFQDKFKTPPYFMDTSEMVTVSTLNRILQSM